MAQIGKVSISLEADSVKFTKGVQDASKDLNKLSNDVEHLKKATAGADIFDKLREGLGRRSGLGEAAELLKGGGPIGGLTGAADAIKSMAEAAKGLKEQFNQGKLSAGELTEKLIEGIPVVGQFWQAGRAIRELFTNEGAELEYANNSAKALDATLKSQKATFELLKQEVREYSEFMNAIGHRIAKAQLGDTDQKDALTQQQQAQEAAKASLDAATERINDQREEKKKQAREEAQGAVDEARKAQEAYQKSDKSGQSTTEVEQHFKTLANIYNNAVEGRKQAEAELDRIYDEKIRAEGIANANDLVAEQDRIARDLGKEHKEQAEKDAKDIADAKADAQAKELEAQGKHIQSQKVLLQKALDDELDTIRKQADEESKTFNQSDTENQQRVQATAAQKAAAAQAKHDADVQAAEREDNIAQSKEIAEWLEKQADEEDKLADKAQKYLDVSPAQKYADELKEINGLKSEGYLTDQQAAVAKGKASRELLDAAAQASKQDERKVGAESRRFDFRLANTPAKQDPIEALKQAAQKQLDSAKKAEYYLQQLYNQGLVDQTPEIADY